jgi:hypothetical protein
MINGVKIINCLCDTINMITESKVLISESLALFVEYFLILFNIQY